MNVPQASTTVSLELPGPPGLTVQSPPQGLRSWMFAGAAFVSGLVYLLRKGYSDGLRRRVIRRLDAVAPRSKYDETKLNDGTIFNADCPVCLSDFARSNDKAIRVLRCGHALCAGCLEAWAVHCTKAHLNPSRFGVTRNGRVIAWTPGPKCPLCCARVNCVPKEDLREAVISAIGHRGVALSTFVAYHANNNNARSASTFRPLSPFENDHSSDEEDERRSNAIADGDGERAWHRGGSINANW